MRVLAAFVMLAGAWALSSWIKRRHVFHDENSEENGGLTKAESAANEGRVLTTRGMETVAAMAAFVLILLAMFLILRYIVSF